MTENDRMARAVHAMAGAVAVAVIAFAGVVGSDAYAKGNSPNAKLCQKGGWITLVRSDGTGFTSAQACVSYAARGGTLLSPAEQCRNEIVAAGVGVPADANYILGTTGDDDLGVLRTSADDVMCGFGGADLVQALNFGDIFVGGDGPDVVQLGFGGIFIGGAGDDAMYELGSGGAFYGGAGNDRFTGDIFAGTFYGGEGDDFAHLLAGGAYDGGGGFDTLEFRGAGTCTNVEVGC